MLLPGEIFAIRYEDSTLTARPSGTFQGLLSPSSGGRFYAEDMARDVTAVMRRLAQSAVASVGRISVPATLLAVAVAFTVFLWVVTVAPSLVSFALTVALAIAWCVWLEKHPEPSGAAEGPPDSIRRGSGGW